MMAGDVADRIGPGLRAACGVTAADSPATVRRKVAGRLVELGHRPVRPATHPDQRRGRGQPVRDQCLDHLSVAQMREITLIHNTTL
jgi:hypothetical protein